jgi:hypothetical protein
LAWRYLMTNPHALFLLLTQTAQAGAVLDGGGQHDLD